MNTIDIVVICLLGFIGLINFIAGFHRGCLNNIFTIAKIALLVVLMGPVAELLKGIDAISSAVDGVIAGLPEMVQFLGSYVYMAISFFVLLIVLSIVLGIIKALLRTPFGRYRAPSPVMVFLDRIAGLAFSVVFYGAIIFALLAIASGVPALASFLEGSKLVEINPLAPLFEGLL